MDPLRAKSGFMKEVLDPQLGSKDHHTSKSKRILSLINLLVPHRRSQTLICCSNSGVTFFAKTIVAQWLTAVLVWAT
jgi:hypothetical protein